VPSGRRLTSHLVTPRCYRDLNAYVGTEQEVLPVCPHPPSRSGDTNSAHQQSPRLSALPTGIGRHLLDLLITATLLILNGRFPYTGSRTPLHLYPHPPCWSPGLRLARGLVVSERPGALRSMTFSSDGVFVACGQILAKTRGRLIIYITQDLHCHHRCLRHPHVPRPPPASYFPLSSLLCLSI
jgi:hypothetical protein